MRHHTQTHAEKQDRHRDRDQQQLPRSSVNLEIIFPSDSKTQVMPLLLGPNHQTKTDLLIIQNNQSKKNKPHYDPTYLKSQTEAMRIRLLEMGTTKGHSEHD